MLAARKHTAVIQLPHKGKFLCLTPRPSSAFPPASGIRLVGWVLTWPLSQNIRITDQQPHVPVSISRSEMGATQPTTSQAGSQPLMTLPVTSSAPLPRAANLPVSAVLALGQNPPAKAVEHPRALGTALLQPAGPGPQQPQAGQLEGKGVLKEDPVWPDVVKVSTAAFLKEDKIAT